MNEKNCDVLIIGAGMAGGCLARQLKIAMPDLKIVLMEKKTEFDYWIGESTVEVWTDYAYRACKLGPYLHKHQILKNGLRFFFDSEKKDLPIHELSENGRAAYPWDTCSHQLDRATFDRDICELNREIGVDVMLGAKVLSDESGKPKIKLDRERGHVVETNHGAIRCRWVVDAGGRTAPVAQLLNLTKPEPRHPVGSYWGRFTKFKDIDDLGPDEWRERVNNTLRYLSTNHWMYPGYWIWVIPLTDKVLSIGVSFNREMNPMKMKNAQDLLTFLRQHKSLAEMLPDSTEALDFMAFQDCTRHASQMFSEDRWFLTGMSGFVIDALYSTTGPTTSFANRLIGEMIKTDREGNQKLFERQVKHFNIYMGTMYENILRMVSRYKEFGSFDLWLGWRNVSQAHYFNTMVSQSAEDMKTFFETVASHGDDCGCSLEKSLDEQKRGLPFAIERLILELSAYLKEKGKFFDGNKGGFVESTPRRSISAKSLKNRRDLQAEHLESLVGYEASYRQFLGRMAHYEGVPWHEDAFLKFFQRDWTSGQSVAMGLEALKAARGTPSSVHKVKWTSKGAYDEHGNEMHPDRLFAEPAYRLSELERTPPLQRTSKKAA